ncbi:MAG: PmoA family protein [Thermoguttaceae bacterium]|nr:PmoA family protein [Thermoguttaceae bacterium]
MQRRDFFKVGAIFGAAGLTASFDYQAQAAGPGERFFAGKSGKPVPEWGDEQVEHLTTYYPDFADKHLWIRKDNQVLTCYRTGSNQKYPYLYPLLGPKSGVSVTTESAQPWPHHRSVFLGADRVNGGNYWQEGSDRGQIHSLDLQLVEATESKVTWTDRCQWQKPGDDPIIEDKRRYVLDWRCDDYYVLDLEVSFEMLADVTIEKTNHGFFGVRVDQDLCPMGGGNLISSNGDVGEKATFGKPAKWMAFYGKRRFNPEITEGVAVFCPPKPFENCEWFTRDYGNISPMPFLFHDEGFHWEKGFVLEAFYRTVVFSGEPKDVDLDGLWNEVYA